MGMIDKSSRALLTVYLEPLYPAISSTLPFSYRGKFWHSFKLGYTLNERLFM